MQNFLDSQSLSREKLMWHMLQVVGMFLLYLKLRLMT